MRSKTHLGHRKDPWAVRGLPPQSPQISSDYLRLGGGVGPTGGVVGLGMGGNRSDYPLF